MDTILEVNDLTKTFKIDQEEYRAVNRVSFSLKAGECVGLIGESGSGKSTVANMVAGLLRPDEGEIIFLKENLLSGSVKSQRKKRK